VNWKKKLLDENLNSESVELFKQKALKQCSQQQQQQQQTNLILETFFFWQQQ
jgi:hypothetical protein